MQMLMREELTANGGPNPGSSGDQPTVARDDPYDPWADTSVPQADIPPQGVPSSSSAGSQAGQTYGAFGGGAAFGGMGGFSGRVPEPPQGDYWAAGEQFEERDQMPFTPEVQPNAPPSPTNIIEDPEDAPPWMKPPFDIPMAEEGVVQEEVPIAMVVDEGGAVQAEAPEPVFVDESNPAQGVPMQSQGVSNFAMSEANQQEEASTENAASTIGEKGVSNPEVRPADASTPVESKGEEEPKTSGNPKANIPFDEDRTRNDPFHMDEFSQALMGNEEDAKAIFDDLGREPSDLDISIFENLPRVVMSIEVLESTMNRPPADHQLNDYRTSQVGKMEEAVAYRLNLHRFGQSCKKHKFRKGDMPVLQFMGEEDYRLTVNQPDPNAKGILGRFDVICTRARRTHTRYFIPEEEPDRNDARVWIAHAAAPNLTNDRGKDCSHLGQGN